MRRVVVVALAAGAARGVVAGAHGGRRGTRGRGGEVEGAEDGGGAGVGGDPLDEDAPLFDGPFREIKETGMGGIGDAGEGSIEESVDPSTMMGGIIGSALQAIDEEAAATRDRHRRDLRPVFPDTPDDSGNENEDGEDGAVLRPKIDPSTIIADLDSDRGVREANEELEASSRHPDTTMSDSDPSSADGVTMTKIASHAATAGNGFLPTMDGPLQSIGPPSEDSSRTFSNAVEELDAEKTVACRNHLNPRHCANMVARTGCEQWVKMESAKKTAHLLTRGLIAHHGAFLVRDLCPRLCGGCSQSQLLDSSHDSSGDLNSNNGALRKPKAKKSFGGVFDIVGGLFGDSETSPSSSPNVNSNISPGDARTDGPS